VRKNRKGNREEGREKGEERREKREERREKRELPGPVAGDWWLARSGVKTGGRITPAFSTFCLLRFTGIPSWDVGRKMWDVPFPL
jgi:hypothetical protein